MFLSLKSNQLPAWKHRGWLDPQYAFEDCSAVGVLQEILQDMVALMWEELNKNETEVSMRYQSGVSQISIAAECNLTTSEVRRILSRVDAKLANSYSKHRLTALIQMPKLPLNNLQLDEVFIKIAALRMDARIEEIREENAKALKDQLVPSPGTDYLF